MSLTLIWELALILWAGPCVPLVAFGEGKDPKSGLWSEGREKNNWIIFT